MKSAIVAAKTLLVFASAFVVASIIYNASANIAGVHGYSKAERSKECADIIE